MTDRSSAMIVMWVQKRRRAGTEVSLLYDLNVVLFLRTGVDQQIPSLSCEDRTKRRGDVLLVTLGRKN